jgi:hypothetical protein
MSHSCETLVTTLMKRDGLSRSEAAKRIREIWNRVLIRGEDTKTVFEEEFGPELDHLFALLGV